MIRRETAPNVATAARSSRRTSIAFWGLVVALAVLVIGSRWTATEGDYSNIDESIASAVIAHVKETGTADTNWLRSDVAEPSFRYNQYNFSAFYLTAAIVLHPVNALTPPDEDSTLIERVRKLNVLFSALGILLTGWIGRSLGGSAAGVIAATLVATHPLLVQDSLYARPEPFYTLLGLGLLSLSMSSASGRWRFGFMGVVLGLMVATKVTAIAFVPVVLLATLLAVERRRWLPYVSLGIVGTVAGFAIGAPYAIANPIEYLEGLDRLLNQYTTGHWPHGVPEADTRGRLAHSLSYFLGTTGAFSFAAAVVGLLSLGKTRPTKDLVLVLGFLASGTYFLFSSVFFERNLSHAVPILMICTSLGIVTATAALGAGASRWPALMALTSAVLLTTLPLTKMILATASSQSRQFAQDERVDSFKQLGLIVTNVGYDRERIDRLARDFCGDWMAVLTDVGDQETEKWLDIRKADSILAERYRIAGPFQRITTSTLQTNHGGDSVFLTSTNSTRNCRISIKSLEPGVNAAGLESGSLVGSGAATLGGHYPDALPKLPGIALMSTWSGSDENLGRVTYEGPLCADQMLPLITGPSFEGTRLKVELLADAEESEVVFEGQLPVHFHQWFGLAINDRKACPRVRVIAIDDSSGWGTWVGLGEPVERQLRPE